MYLWQYLFADQNKRQNSDTCGFKRLPARSLKILKCFFSIRVVIAIGRWGGLVFAVLGLICAAVTIICSSRKPKYISISTGWWPWKNKEGHGRLERVHQFYSWWNDSSAVNVVRKPVYFTSAYFNNRIILKRLKTRGYICLHESNIIWKNINEPVKQIKIKKIVQTQSLCWVKITKFILKRP